MMWKNGYACWNGGYTQEEVIDIFRQQGYPMRSELYDSLTYDQRLEEFPGIVFGEGVEDLPDGLGALLGTTFVVPLDDKTIGVPLKNGKGRAPMEAGVDALLNYDMLLSWLCCQWEALNQNVERYWANDNMEDLCIFIDKGAPVYLSMCRKTGFSYQGFGLRTKTFLRRESDDHLIFSRHDMDNIETVANKLYDLCRQKFVNVYGEVIVFHEDIPAPSWCFDDYDLT